MAILITSAVPALRPGLDTEIKSSKPFNCQFCSWPNSTDPNHPETKTNHGQGLFLMIGLGVGALF